MGFFWGKRGDFLWVEGGLRFSSDCSKRTSNPTFVEMDKNAQIAHHLQDIAGLSLKGLQHC